MDKFKGKYRIPSARWAAWDYGCNAAYFVTICTDDRANRFGEISAGVMTFTPLGQAAVDCWNEIPAHFPFVVLDGFVIMPNHVHGIVVIDKRDDAAQSPTNNQFGPQSQNLASIVRGYKIDVTKFARQYNIPFAWQARYHDHVIRNAGEHERIRKYIRENPEKWKEDRFYVPHLL